MKRLSVLGLFALLVCAQLAVPASMINKRQTTLAEGAVYKFRIGPVDPYDPFLGRYMVLNLEAAQYDRWQGEPLLKGQTVYAVLETDNDGFARIRGLSMDPPGTRDYLSARVAWQSGKDVRLQLPFSRYYLEEHAAQNAWRVRRNGRRQPVPAHIQVHVLNGFGVLEGLYFDNQPILEYMRARGLWSPGTALAPKSQPVTEPVPTEPAAQTPSNGAEIKAEGSGTAE